MFKAFEFCIPTRGIKVPSGPDWLHEIKYDGYRLRVERNGDRVRLITRGGYDLVKALSLDRRVRAEEQIQAIRYRRRSGGARCRWHLRFQRAAFWQEQ